MKNLEELTFEESKQFSGGFDFPRPWHGLPPDYFKYRIRRWDPNAENAIREAIVKIYR